MKKLNNKGVTLVELIVSFAIVAVAIIYFFQTLYTVKTLYTQTNNETNEYVVKDYGLRFANALSTGDLPVCNSNTTALRLDYDNPRIISTHTDSDGIVPTKSNADFICKNYSKEGIYTKLYKYFEVNNKICSYYIVICY